MPLMPHWPLYLGPNKDITISPDRVYQILEKFDNPQDKLKNVIHITGTNGKGSTTSYIASILQDTGYKVGKYTSPHIHLCNERVQINGEIITDNEMYEIIEEIRYFCEAMNINPTIFEVTTILAIIYFYRKDCDFSVIEVGMGGLLDATNVFEKNKPIASVITPIHLDHTKYLGNTIKEIAWQKSFIIKGNGVCVCAPQPTEAMEVVKQRCNDVNAKLYIFDEDFTCYKIDSEEYWLFEMKTKKYDIEIDEEIFLPYTELVFPDYQLQNCSVSIATILVLKNLSNE